VIGDQRPGEAIGISRFEQRGEAIDKIPTIGVVAKNVAALDTTNDNVLQQSGNIDAGLSGHGTKSSRS